MTTEKYRGVQTTLHTKAQRWINRRSDHSNFLLLGPHDCIDERPVVCAILTEPAAKHWITFSFRKGHMRVAFESVAMELDAGERSD